MGGFEWEGHRVEIQPQEYQASLSLYMTLFMGKSIAVDQSINPHVPALRRIFISSPATVNKFAWLNLVCNMDGVVARHSTQHAGAGYPIGLR